MLRFTKVAVASTILLSSAAPFAAAQPRDIGKAVAVTNQVSAEDEQKTAKRVLAKGDPVHEMDLLESGRNSAGEFILDNDTKLALGPDARLVLDKLAYDPNQPNKVAIKFALGAFRFISGKGTKEAYELRTPSATLGIRGTVFDFYIAKTGAMAVLMHNGALDICGSACRLHSKKDRVAYVNPAGRIVIRRGWDPSLFPGINLRQAFPFLGKKLAIDPVVRHANFAPPQAPITKHAGLPSGTPGWISNTFADIGTALDNSGSGSGKGLGSVASSGGGPGDGGPGGGGGGGPGGGGGGGSGGTGPGNGNGNAGNPGNGGGNLGGSGPGTGNGGKNNGNGKGGGGGGKGK